MNDTTLLYILTALAAAAVILLAAVLIRQGRRKDIDIRAELNAAKDDIERANMRLRQEVVSQFRQMGDSTVLTMTTMAANTETNMAELRRTVDERLAAMQREDQQRSAAQRETLDRRVAELQAEVVSQFRQMGDSTVLTMTTMAANTETNMGELRRTVDERLTAMQNENRQRSAAERETLERRVTELQTSVDKRLSDMQEMVDKNLTERISTGLNTSFAAMNAQLDQVYKSLGEMRQLNEGVIDLKHVLANVKTRGVWGEIQLGRLLEDMLAPGQYDRNVSFSAGREAVEYAIRLPGAEGEPVWLPIDSKFPMDRYEAVLNAQDAADSAAYAEACAALAAAVMAEGKSIKTKYILPPKTTDFAVMFVPSEGLYAQLASQGIIERLQREHRVLLSGPATFAALLSSLQAGFRSVAIERRSAQIMELLAAVKKSIGNFSDNIDKTLKNLHTATNNLEKASQNTRGLKSKLRNVEQLSDERARELLGDEFFDE